MQGACSPPLCPQASWGSWPLPSMLQPARTPLQQPRASGSDFRRGRGQAGHLVPPLSLSLFCLTYEHGWRHVDRQPQPRACRPQEQTFENLALPWVEPKSPSVTPFSCS
ncbi:Hypothetical predicted protein [Marmota monax]|uniref:Uncharacterized protein n=1 Tax=Marmota monax TaxID=9995 RepID=A0A5E4AIH4_MARMO|nr:hypothetical protein GHT09_011886 [Marmota monax]VTJ56601.1 Hypothetical predicted protein [Marmota monax]